MNRVWARLKLAANRKPLKERLTGLDRSPLKLAARSTGTAGRLAFAWGPAAVWAAVLFLLSSLTPSDDLARFAFPMSDKVAHLMLYSVLGGTLAWGRHRSGWAWPHVFFILLGALYGASDEWHQSFVPGRMVSVGDWVADTLGVLVGYALFRTLISSRRHAGLDHQS